LTFSDVDPTCLMQWMLSSSPLEGVYYRSVSYKYCDPDKVLNGQGTYLYGGRFASIGTRAVYVAETDMLATAEVTVRKNRLGVSIIKPDAYPRISYTIRCSLERVVSMAGMPKALDPLRGPLMDDDLSVSQQLGSMLLLNKVQGLLAPSATDYPGNNLVVYLDNCLASSVAIENVQQVKHFFQTFIR
jgi:RES domain-containing protein